MKVKAVENNAVDDIYSIRDAWYESLEGGIHNEHYRYLVEVSSDAILIARDGRLLFMNKAALKLFNATEAAQLIGQSITDILSTDSSAGAEDHAVMNAKKSNNGEFVKCKLARLDGTYVDVDVAVSVANYNGNTITQYIVRSADVFTQPEYHLSYLAQYDLLTELPNRSQFRDRLRGAMSRARRNHQLIAVMFLGLDQFKKLNRVYGPASGDLLLQHLAQRLKGCTRESDTIARLGGDEFALILEGLIEKEGATVVAKRIQGQLALPFQLNGQEIRVAASIGTAIYPADAEELEQLWRYTDVALYYAKACGGNNYRPYKPEIESLSQRDELRQSQTRQKLATLTAREREVLDMLTAGKANKMIAYLLGTSTRTIENHRAKIMGKMEVDSLPELVRIIIDVQNLPKTH